MKILKVRKVCSNFFIVELEYMFKFVNILVVIFYFKYIDREINDYIDKVFKGKVGYQRVGVIFYVFVLVNDFEQGCIFYYFYDENSIRYYSVNVFES